MLFGAYGRDMDTITIRYKDNASVHYDGKECAESLFPPIHMDTTKVV